MSRASDAPGGAPTAVRRSLARHLSGVFRATHRPRLALVTPWPPEQSGIAAYSRRLTRELAQIVDVTIVVSGTLADYEQPLEPGVRLISASSRRTSPWLRRQDHVLYCMGNSGFHGHVYRLLRERAGAVLLHDVQLTGFFGWYAGSQRPDDPVGWLFERVQRHYGARIAPDVLRSAMLSSQERDARGIYMTAELRQFAERLFVHSQSAREVLERDAGDVDRPVPVTVMPFGMPPPRDDGVRPTAAQPPLVVHMGAISETKGIGALIEAFGALSLRHPGARLVLAGSADEFGPAHWEALAREHAPGASVEIAGYVESDRYDELLRTADLAVQLRSISNGEASAAVGDCLAAGIPTIVTDSGWTGELPPTAARRVPPGASAQLLAEQMNNLIVDREQRLALSAGALAHARECSFRIVAAAYVSALGLA